MATKIGDEGMVLPDAPKLMFDQALKLEGRFSDHILGILKKSLQVGDDFHSGTVDATQLNVLREWQEVTTKARLINKIDFNELVSLNYPLPLLATLKEVRDRLPSRPITPGIDHLAEYPALIEAYNQWENQQLILAGEMVAAFTERAPSGVMTEADYLNMHVAMSAALQYHNSRKNVARHEWRDWLNHEELHLALRGLDEQSQGESLPISDDFRFHVFDQISVDDIVLADSFLAKFTSTENSLDLRYSIDKSLSTTYSSDLDLPRSEWRQIDRMKHKLRGVETEIKIGHYTALSKSLHNGVIRADRRGYRYLGLMRCLSNRFTEQPSEALRIHREGFAEGMLGLKSKRKQVANEVNEGDSLPEGTPVDENNNPLPQPKRPERLDLSAEIAALEGDDSAEDQGSAYEDFRFLVDDFGFRGLQIGNYVPQKMRRYLTGAIHQSITDLAEVVSIPPTLVALGNPLPEELKGDPEVEHQSYPGMSLGLALGARGKGKASAHYEPGGRESTGTKRHIINMTRDKGSGSLSHEIGHALDYTISDLCDLDASVSGINEKTVSRITGNSISQGISTVSEAWAVHWTMATNHHLMRDESLPTNERLRRIATNMLKPNYRTDANIDMVLGIGMAMKHAYTHEHTANELLLRHAVKFSEEVIDNFVRAEKAICVLAQDYFQLDSIEAAKDRLVTMGFWSNAPRFSEKFIEDMTQVDDFHFENWVREAAKSVAKAMITVASGREPADITLNRFAAAFTHLPRFISKTSTLLQDANHEGRYWHTEAGHNAIAGVIEQKLSHENISQEHIERIEKSRQSAMLSQFIRGNRDTYWLSYTVDPIGFSSSGGQAAYESLKEELRSPTPHEMEKTLAQSPASIQREQLDEASKGELFSSLSFLNTSKDILALADGIRALVQHLEAEGESLSEDRLDVHPRLMARLGYCMEGKLNVALFDLFAAERKLMEDVGINPDQGESPHPLIPSTRARQELDLPENLEKAFKFNEENSHGEYQALRSPSKIMGLMVVTQAVREVMPRVMEAATPAMQLAVFAEAIKGVRDELVTPCYLAAEDRTWDQPITPPSEEIQSRIAPYEKAYLASVVQQAVEAGETSDAYLDKQGNVNGFYYEQGYRSIGEAFGQIRRALSALRHSRYEHSTGEISRGGTDASSMIARILERGLHHGGEGVRERSGEVIEADCKPERYIEGLKTLAEAVDRHATSFAYMAPQERREVLSDVFGDNATPEREDFSAIYSGGMNEYGETPILYSRKNPPFDLWLKDSIAVLSAKLHLRELSSSEQSIAEAMRNSYKDKLAPGIPLAQSSRLLRASAAYEGRVIELNGYLRGNKLKYWATPVEIFARSFETHVFDRLKEMGRESKYLVTVADPDRQERQMEAHEALVVKKCWEAFGAAEPTTVESRMFRDFSPDYSLTYPSAEERLHLDKAFSPLVESLSKGLSAMFPAALELHEHNLANGVYEKDKRKVAMMQAQGTLEREAPATTGQTEINVASSEKSSGQIKDEAHDNLHTEAPPLSSDDIEVPDHSAEPGVSETPDVAPKQDHGEQTDAPSVDVLEADEAELHVPPALRPQQKASQVDESKSAQEAAQQEPAKAPQGKPVALTLGF